MITSHTDVVGSLLRPPELLEASEKVASGLISRVEFKANEDRPVDKAIAFQEDAGLGVVTNGEQRRLSFQRHLPEAVEGFGHGDSDAFEQRLNASPRSPCPAPAYVSISGRPNTRRPPTPLWTASWPMLSTSCATKLRSLSVWKRPTYSWMRLTTHY